MLAHHLLQDDCHLLLVDDIGGGRHVVLRTAVEDRGIDRLDGIGEEFHTTVFVLDVGNHVGAVDAGKRLVMRVFEQRRGTDGDRPLDHLHEGLDVAHQAVGQMATQEDAEDIFVRRIAQSHLVELVLVHELVEDVGAEHYGLGDTGDVVLALQVLVVDEHAVQERQTATFAT